MEASGAEAVGGAFGGLRCNDPTAKAVDCLEWVNGGVADFLFTQRRIDGRDCNSAKWNDIIFLQQRKVIAGVPAEGSGRCWRVPACVGL